MVLFRFDVELRNLVYPRSTLHDHTSGCVLPGAVSGPKRHLHVTNEEEEELVHFLLGCASIGYRRTWKEIISLVLVQQIVNKYYCYISESNATVTLGWWESFEDAILSFYFGLLSQYLVRVLLVAVMRSLETILNCWDTLEDNELLEKPCQIFNTYMYETRMPLDQFPPLIAAGRGQRHPQGLTSGNKSQITVLSFCSAARIVLPPLIIFNRKALKAEMTND